MQKLNGFLNLSKIPKELISTNKKGEKGIWIDVLANKNGVDQYGSSHTITLYDKNERKSIYLANLKTLEFGNASAMPEPKGYQPKNAVPDPAPNAPIYKAEDLGIDQDLPFN